MRRVACVDENQRELVKAMRRLGVSVQLLHAVGQGCPDVLVGWKGRNLLLEVKDGSKVPSARKLTEAQEEWHRAWRGQVAVVSSLDEVIDVLGLHRG